MGQQIAQLTQDADLKSKVVAGDPAAVEAWNRIHPRAADQYVNVPDGEEVDANGNVLRRPNRLVNARTGEEKARQQASAGIHTDPKALAIRDNAKLSVEEKKKQLSALGYK